MEQFKNVTLDSLAVASIGTGIAMVGTAGDKWYIGLVLIAVGVGLSFMKYHLRK